MLPILEYTNNLWDSPSLENIAIIAAQHVMESTFAMFKNLKNNGLNPNQTFILGKCYSTSLSVVEDYKSEGFQISEMSAAYDSHQPFDDYYQLQIIAFAEHAIANLNIRNIHKIIVLDDGGYLLHYLATHSLIKTIPLVGIEQTSSGFNFLSQTKLTFPIVNVARSKAKLTLETPFIINSCFQRLFHHIPLEKIVNKTSLILGNGVIGSYAAEMLSEYAVTMTYDPKTMSRETLLKLLPQADLILGCSGYKAISYEDYPYLKPGVNLVSFSSSDREFDAATFRKLFPKSYDCRVNHICDDITLIQSGFPINFWGDRMNMPMEHIQVTLALLTAAIYQALSITSSPLLDTVDTQCCDRILLPVDQESELLIMQEVKKNLHAKSYVNL